MLIFRSLPFKQLVNRIKQLLRELVNSDQSGLIEHAGPTDEQESGITFRAKSRMVLQVPLAVSQLTNKSTSIGSSSAVEGPTFVTHHVTKEMKEDPLPIGFTVGMMARFPLSVMVSDFNGIRFDS